MNNTRMELAGLCLGLLAAACVHTKSNQDGDPPAQKKISAEESSFRLFSAPVQQDASTQLEATTSPAQRLTTSVPRSAGRRPDLRAQLKQTTVPGFMIQEEDSLRAVVSAVRNMTGLPLVVHQGAENAVLDAGIVFDFQFDNELSATNLLNLITGMTDGQVAWTIRHDVVLFTAEAHAGARLIVHAHDIHDLVMPRTDFSAPRLDRLRLLDDLEDDDGGGPFGGSEQVTVMTEEDVLTLVQETVAPLTWDLDGVRIDAENGQLIVVHTAEVQLRIQRFLASIQ